MKTTVTLSMLLALVSYVLAAPFRSDMKNLVRVPETPFCRLFQGPSRCVDEPLKIIDSEPWCPYRMCAPSYVPAELCPPSIELQATNKCAVEMITRDVYKCDGHKYGHNFVPLGCTPGTSGCNEVPTCSCVKVIGVTSKVLREIAPFTPQC